MGQGAWDMGNWEGEAPAEPKTTLEGTAPAVPKKFCSLEGTAPAVPKKSRSLEGTPPGVPKFFGRAGTKLEGNAPAMPNLFKFSVVQERNWRAALLSSRMFQNFRSCRSTTLQLKPKR
jgi:hypothetical protein